MSPAETLARREEKLEEVILTLAAELEKRTIELERYKEESDYLRRGWEGADKMLSKMGTIHQIAKSVMTRKQVKILDEKVSSILE